MNQAIQFPDDEHWDDGLQAVCFAALVNGFRITCAIRHQEMVRRFGPHLPEQSLPLFTQHRWDLEEEAEDLIRGGHDDDKGWYWLS